MLKTLYITVLGCVTKGLSELGPSRITIFTSIIMINNIALFQRTLDSTLGPKY